MSRVSKAGRYTEILQEEIGKKLIESQEKFPDKWNTAMETNSKIQQLDRITEGQIDEVLTYGYPEQSYQHGIEPEPAQPTPQPTPQPKPRRSTSPDLDMDTILDKIFNQGMGSLSPDELNFLQSQ